MQFCFAFTSKPRCDNGILKNLKLGRGMNPVLKFMTMGIIKFFGGYTQDDMTRALANIVDANLYSFIGKDTTISDADKFDYIKDGYMSVPYAFEAIQKITNKIAACPILIYEVKSGQKLKQYDGLVKGGRLTEALKVKSDAMVEVDVPRIRKLLDSPNPNQTADEFIRMISILVLASGNALVYGEGGDARSRKLSEMWALPFNPLQYKIVSDGIMDPVKGYRVNCNAGALKMDFDAEKICHIKTVNPLWQTSGGQLYGMSPLHAYVSKLVRSKLGDDAQNRLLKNGFKIGIVSPKHKEDGWDADQAIAVRDRLRNAARAGGDFDRIIATSHSLDYLPIGLDSTELGVDALNKADRSDVYAAYDIPRLMATTDASTYNNEEIVGRKFIYDAVVPYATLISDALTKFICAPFEKADSKRYVIRLDFLSLPELATDMVKAVEWLKNAPYLTMNEKREVLGFGRLDTQGMDEVILSRNDVPLSRIVSGENLRSGSSGNKEGSD